MAKGTSNRERIIKEFTDDADIAKTRDMIMEALDPDCISAGDRIMERIWKLHPEIKPKPPN